MMKEQVTVFTWITPITHLCYFQHYCPTGAQVPSLGPGTLHPLMRRLSVHLCSVLMLQLPI